MKKVFLLLLITFSPILGQNHNYDLKDLVGKWKVYETKVDEDKIPDEISIKNMLEINASKSERYKPDIIIITSDSIFLKNPNDEIIISSRFDLISISNLGMICKIGDNSGKIVMKSVNRASLSVNSLTYYLQK